MNRIKSITSTSSSAYSAAENHWNDVAKPLGSFAVLEDYIKKIAAVQGTEKVDISKRAAVVMCGDHGVVAEGVTQAPSSVTAECACAIAEGRSNINALADIYNAEVIAVDTGICTDVECEKLVKKKVAYGTENMAKGPAMTAEQAKQAIAAGIDAVSELKEKGINIIVTGEMGIGNTTSASALASAFFGLPAEEVTGRGAGLSSEGLARKINTVKKAVEVNCPDAANPLDVLSKLGGYDVAGMTGLFLGGACCHIPVIIDGVISAAAAYIAYRIEPKCAEYMLAGHRPSEPAGKKFLDALGLDAVIDAQLRLGEGTGGILLLPLLDGAMALYNNAHKFDEMSIERYEKLV